MTRQPKFTAVEAALEHLADAGLDGLASAIEVLLNEAMKLERDAFLQAEPHERTEERRGYANGYKDKTVRSRLGALQLAVPQVRDVVDGASFYPQALERGERSERALKLALAEMYVQGVSTRKVAAITEQLCGQQISSTTVSRVAAELDEQLEAWRTRPLAPLEYLVLDAMYEKVRHGGSVVSQATLIAIGIDAHGRRSILGCSVSLSEAEVHWREFLASLRDRGVCGLRMIVSDDHVGIKAACTAVFPGVAWQRCQVHLQRNAAGYVPRLEMRKTVARELRDVFNAPSREDAERLLGLMAERYRETAPRLAAWLEEAVPEGFAVFALPISHRRRLRSTNLMESINSQVRRRTRVAGLFPNEASLLRLVSAMLQEISEEWETGRRYLPEGDG